MNALMTLSAVATVTVLLGLLVGMSRHGINRRAAHDRVIPVLAPATVSPVGVRCGLTGHHYLRRETGWCCAHCGDEVRTDVHSAVGVSA